MSKHQLITFCTCVCFCLISCQKQDNHPEKLTERGKKLFFDARLSRDKDLSCASCHVPSLAFSDGKALRTSKRGRQLDRNAPALFNLAWMDKGLFWDGGARTLERLALAPLTHPDEMGMDVQKLPQKLRATGDYSDTISLQGILVALADYQRSLTSFSAKYDRVKAGKESFSEKEEQGYILYQQHCAACHAEGLFTDNDFHNNGLNAAFPTEAEHPEQGRFRITLDSADMGKFKTPSLRNLSFTAPYMHEGRFRSLEAVLEHYQSGIQPSKTLDERLQRPIFLSEAERMALLAFLRTLNDSSFVNR